LLSLVHSEMAKARWHKMTKAERSKVMRLVAQGDDKPKKRCPCGVMTLARAVKRRHVVDGQCRPGVGL